MRQVHAVWRRPAVVSQSGGVAVRMKSCPHDDDGRFISCSLRSVRAYTLESVHRRSIGSLDKFVPWLPKRDQPDRDETSRVTSTPPERSQSQHSPAEDADLSPNPPSTCSGLLKGSPFRPSTGAQFQELKLALTSRSFPAFRSRALVRRPSFSGASTAHCQTWVSNSRVIDSFPNRH